MIPYAIAVMGVSGSGKSTLAEALASALGCEYIEGDAFHSDKAIEKMRNGIALNDDDRWPWLERLGRAAESAIGDDGMAVIACSALKRSYRDCLRNEIKAHIYFVLLTTDKDELARRLNDRSGHFMPVRLLTSQLAALEGPYEDEQAITLDARDPKEKLCDSTIAWLIAQTEQMQSTTKSKQ
jgi:gluconokinase